MALADATRGLVLGAEDHPGVLLDVRYDDEGDLDRASFIVRVTDRRHEFPTMLPALGGGFQDQPRSGPDAHLVGILVREPDY